MSIMFKDQSGGWRGHVAIAALIFSIFAVFWFAIAALGSKYGVWSWQFGLSKMTIGWGQAVVMATLGLSVLACILALIKAPRKRPFILAFVALLISALLGGRMLGLASLGQSVPPIHDIQTDWSNPVMFSETLINLRGDGANPVRETSEAVFGETSREEWQSYVGQSIQDIQEAAECPSHDEKLCEDSAEPKPYKIIEPLYLDQPTASVFEAARRLVQSRGWTIVSADPAEGRLEATQTSPWWGFKDDVAIRITQEEGRTRVDMRSVSRVGISDLGANARRISAFLYDLDAQPYSAP